MEKLLCSWIGTLNIEDVKTIQKKKNYSQHLHVQCNPMKKSSENFCGNRNILPKIHMESQGT